MQFQFRQIVFYYTTSAETLVNSSSISLPVFLISKLLLRLLLN